jgi:DNA-binding transcriptional ArsR family regulator
MVQQGSSTDHLSATFGALADPTRRAILAVLARGEASVTDLGAPFEMSLPAVSKHLKVLERAGLITRGRTAQWRPCQLKAAPLKDAAGWLERYRTFWEESFDRLDDYLREWQKASGGRPRPERTRQRSVVERAKESATCVPEWSASCVKNHEGAGNREPERASKSAENLKEKRHGRKSGNGGR